MGWLDERWHSVISADPATWLAWSAWMALALGVAALIYLHRHLSDSRRVSIERSRPHVTMFMEPHAADWHVIELVARNFGETPAYDVTFDFPHPPTVARYETAAEGYADVVALKLPDNLPVLAPGQEWRTVWDSAIDRTELGDAIESRFTGVVSYHDAPEQPPRRWRRWRRERTQFSNNVILDWNDLPPVQRLELLTTHDLAKREKQKLELLRSLLTYFHYASKETDPDVFRREIDRVNRATRETQDRLRSREQGTDATATTLRLSEPGKRRQR